MLVVEKLADGNAASNKVREEADAQQQLEVATQSRREGGGGFLLFFLDIQVRLMLDLAWRQQKQQHCARLIFPRS